METNGVPLSAMASANLLGDGTITPEVEIRCLRAGIESLKKRCNELTKERGDLLLILEAQADEIERRGVMRA